MLYFRFAFLACKHAGLWETDSPPVNMTPRIRQHAVRRPSQRRPHAQLVPHGAADDEQPCSLARHVRYIRLERIGGRVFSEDVILQSAVASGRQHGGRRGSDRIAWRDCQLCFVWELGDGVGVGNGVWGADALRKSKAAEPGAHHALGSSSEHDVDGGMSAPLCPFVTASGRCLLSVMVVSGFGEEDEGGGRRCWWRVSGLTV